MFQLPARRVWYLSSCDDWVVRIIRCSNNDVTFTTQWIIYRQYETSRSGIVSAGYSVGVLGDRSRNCCNWGSAETRNSRRFASSVSRQEIQFSKLSNLEYSDNCIINLSETSLVWLILTDSCSEKKSSISQISRKFHPKWKRCLHQTPTVPAGLLWADSVCPRWG